ESRRAVSWQEGSHLLSSGLMIGSVLVFVANGHRRVSGWIEKLAGESGSLVGFQDDGADGALDTLDFHDLVLQDIPEFLDIVCSYEVYDVEVAGTLVELLHIVQF